MGTIRIKFQEVKVKATRKWRDDDGKVRQLTETFSQTVNPWNKRADGKMKTEAEIREELEQQKLDWLGWEWMLVDSAKASFYPDEEAAKKGLANIIKYHPDAKVRRV